MVIYINEPEQDRGKIKDDLKNDAFVFQKDRQISSLPPEEGTVREEKEEEEERSCVYLLL